MNGIYATITGALVVILTAADVFRSLIVPRQSTRLLRLGPVLVATLFPFWHFMTRLVPQGPSRQSLRANLAPFMLVLSLGIWASFLILGFALMFWGNRVAFEPGLLTFGDAIFAAGSAFTTLGVYGPVSGALPRALVVGCALSGFSIVTVVATFLISVQQAFGRRETLVARLESRVTLPPTGIAILESYAVQRIECRLGPFFDNWEGWAADVGMSHRAFPILLVFRSNDSRCEWLAALAAVLDAAALIDAAIEGINEEASAAAHFMLQTGGSAIRSLSRQAVPDANSRDEATTRERFDREYDRLGRAGYRLVADPAQAFQRFRTRRATYAPQLEALARQLRIDLPADDPANTSHPRGANELE